MGGFFPYSKRSARLRSFLVLIACITVPTAVAQIKHKEELKEILNTIEQTRINNQIDQQKNGIQIKGEYKPANQAEEESIQSNSKQFGSELDLRYKFDFVDPTIVQEEGSSEPLVQSPSVSEVLLRTGLKKVKWLQKSGAYSLAAAVLLEDRPDISDTVTWIKWERLLWDTYKDQSLWQELSDRIDLLPDELPEVYRVEAGVVKVDALMQLGQIVSARQYLRSLLATGSDDPRLVASWRRLIMQSYLWENNLVDTDISMQRFQAQYFPDDNRWNIMRAQVLLKTENFEAAISQLASTTNEEARLLRLIGRMGQNSLTPNEVIDRALELKPGKLSQSLQRDRWALIAEAAATSGVQSQRVSALEQALSVEKGLSSNNLIPLNVDDLLHAYIVLAEQTGNRAHLLVGDYEGWLNFADTLRGDSSVGARAIYVYIGKAVELPILAKEAFSRFADSLHKDKLKTLLFSFIGPDKPFGGFDVLKGETGFLLAEEALEEENIRLAAAISSSITEPPGNTSYFNWRLRQSRMLIFAGDYGAGAQILSELMSALTNVSVEESDRILQLIFDLQSVGQHELAIPLLETVLNVSESARLKEILFWLAESLEATDSKQRAALFFLRSASLAGGANDMWSQSARYRAAVALQDAGFIKDSRAIYNQLLSVTTDARHRQRLSRRIQQLWLLETKNQSESES
ncbi:MAG: hypothetical protein ACI8P9_002669 [Parasphingorhabdus sp.]